MRARESLRSDLRPSQIAINVRLVDAVGDHVEGTGMAVRLKMKEKRASNSGLAPHPRQEFKARKD